MHSLAVSSTVEVWYVDPGQLVDPESVERCRARVTREDLSRITRSILPDDRHARLVAWALVRMVLSRHAPVAPGAWRFTAGEHGRPEIAEPALTRPLRFNLSHTAGIAACAVADLDDLGLDVEDVRRRADIRKIVRRFFAPFEVAAIEGLDDERRPLAFFERWTLKEAYLKARGAGLSLPLAEVAFAVAPDRPPAVSFGPAIRDTPDAWQFAHVRPTPYHLAAVAIRRPASAGPVEIVLRQAIPGVHL
jgi:4'-phosphopantetheinyl transferase